MSNVDYETYWQQEERSGWLFLLASIIGFIVYHHWIDHDLLHAFIWAFYGLAAGLLRTTPRGKAQAQILQEREAEIDWALTKLRKGDHHQ